MNQLSVLTIDATKLPTPMANVWYFDPPQAAKATLFLVARGIGYTQGVIAEGDLPDGEIITDDIELVDCYHNYGGSP